jgi:hypothetical protein
MNVILQSVYAGNVNYYAAILKSDKVLVDVNEHFLKQSYRNRCVIAGANGPLNLIVPVRRKNGRVKLKDIEIDYSENWQKIHWKSIESAYRTSPYFEFYEDRFKALYASKELKLLMDWNFAINNAILKSLKYESEINISDKYVVEKDGFEDLRGKIHPKKQHTSHCQINIYPQVFDDRMDFLPNISVLDLLFNEGPAACQKLLQ